MKVISAVLSLDGSWVSDTHTNQSWEAYSLYGAEPDFFLKNLISFLLPLQYISPIK